MLFAGSFNVAPGDAARAGRVREWVEAQKNDAACDEGSVSSTDSSSFRSGSASASDGGGGGGGGGGGEGGGGINTPAAHHGTPAAAGALSIDDFMEAAGHGEMWERASALQLQIRAVSTIFFARFRFA
jgi:hypothetical protein